MKGLATLIKLHKRTLDDLRRRMADLEKQKLQFLQLSANLEKELRDEIAQASKAPELGNFFGGFSRRIQKRQEEIAQEVRKLDNQMLKLNQEITAAFSELKKFEIAQENARKRDAEEQQRRETIMMDEIAGQQHARKRDDA